MVIDVNALEFIEQVQRLYAAEDYVEALTAIAAAEAEGKATVELLLLKAACIQLSSNTDYPLVKAFEIYESIFRRRPNDVRALAEAGFFLLNVQDNALASEQYFERAANACSDQLSEVISGLVRARGKGGRSSEATAKDIDTLLEQLRTAILQRL